MKYSLSPHYIITSTSGVDGVVATNEFTFLIANRKTFRELHQEIRAAQVENVAEAVVGFKLVQLMPTFLFNFLLWMVARYPQMAKK